MGIMTSYIIPIIVTMMIMVFTGLAGFGFYKFLRKILPKELNAWMKYGLLKKDMPEKDVIWCLEAYERGATITEVIRYLRLHGVDDARVEETTYIYKRIIKLKGGLKSNGRQIETSPIKTFNR